MPDYDDSQHSQPARLPFRHYPKVPTAGSSLGKRWRGWVESAPGSQAAPPRRYCSATRGVVLYWEACLPDPVTRGTWETGLEQQRHPPHERSRDSSQANGMLTYMRSLLPRTIVSHRCAEPGPGPHSPDPTFLPSGAPCLVHQLTLTMTGMHRLSAELWPESEPAAELSGRSVTSNCSSEATCPQ